MSVLAPLYALGVLAVGLPLIFHLIQRRPRGRRPFSSLMFLSPSPPRLTRRSRLENLLLLLLRAAALLLLALAFARPLWRAIAARDIDAPARRILLLVDTSASMRRQGLWKQAVDHVDRVLQDLQATDDVALFAFDSTVRPLVHFQNADSPRAAQHRAAIRAALRDTGPTWSATELGRALVAGSDTLQTAREDRENQGSLPPRIVVVTDLQEGCLLEPLDGYEWPAGVQLDIRRVAAAKSTNASGLILAENDEDQRKAAELRVRVHNAADSRGEQFRLGWADEQGRLLDEREYSVHVPPGESRVMRVAQAATPAGRLLLIGDDHSFDNMQYVARQPPVQKTLLYVGDDSEGDGEDISEDRRSSLVYYLRRAALDTAQQQVTVEHRAGDQPLPELNPDEMPLVVVAAPLAEGSADQLKRYMHEGGRLLIVLGTPPDEIVPMTGFVRQLTSIDDLRIEEAQVSEYAMLSRINFRHPIFQPFADPRFSDFTKIHFWSYRRISASEDAPWNVLARFDDQAPALVERRHGEGGWWILTCGWQPRESQLALSTKFVPLLAGMFDPSGGRPLVLSSYEVRQTVELPKSWSGAEVLRPDGAVSVLKDTSVFSETGEPGIYRLARGNIKQAFAVNVAASESRTAPLDPEVLEQRGVKLGRTRTAAEVENQRRQMRDVELERRQKLWQWLILSVLAVLVAETWLGARSKTLSSPDEGSNP